MSRLLVLFVIAVLVVQLSLTDAADVCAKDGARCHFHKLHDAPEFECCKNLICFPLTQRCMK
nr:venom polypeptide precursor [Doratifera vulnerans]